MKPKYHLFKNVKYALEGISILLKNSFPYYLLKLYGAGIMPAVTSEPQMQPPPV